MPNNTALNESRDCSSSNRYAVKKIPGQCTSEEIFNVNYEVFISFPVGFSFNHTNKAVGLNKMRDKKDAHQVKLYLILKVC